VVEEAQLPPEPPVGSDAAGDHSVGKGAWFAWWSRPDGYGSDGEKRSKRLKVEVEDASSTPLPGTPIVEPADGALKMAQDFEGIGGNDTKDTASGLRPELKGPQPSARSWFGIWSLTQNQPSSDHDATKDDATEQPPDLAVSVDPPETEQHTTATQPDSQNTTIEAQAPPKASGWAFWSTDKAKDPAPTPGGTQKQVGELAVADTPSQSHPEVAQFNEQRDESKSESTKSDVRRAGSLLNPKRGSKSKEKINSDSSASAPTPAAGSSAAQTPTSETPSRSRTPPPLEASSILSRLPDQPKPPANKQERPNLILPSFQTCFSNPPNPGYIERLTAYLAQSLRLPGAQPPPPPLHVYRSPTPPRIKKAVALGVHGFFPTALIQKFIGQPKGTSVRFANHAATAIKTWCDERQPDIKNVEIEKVALEGEGYIADRVTTLWKLLLNWLSHLRQADFILIACHSQGVPVAVMLVAKLIQLGCLGPNVRLGICAMAGINLGPFLEYRSRLFGGTALELFDFNDPNSTVSRAYAEGLDLCLRHGVRITFAGSIDDQLVSLESSLHTPLHHPYVMRAVFIDGRLHAPNFLTHLIVFAAKLRNLGVSDHGLIRELSAPLAGSIVGGEGHSRIYDEVEVYRIAIEFALESTHIQPPAATTQPNSNKKLARRNSNTPNLPTSPAVANQLRRSSVSLTSPTVVGPPPASVQPTFKPYEPPPSAVNSNPFYLPWAVRGLLEEDLVKTDEGLSVEVRQLVKEFEDWRPTSKVLRDVRFRLEGVRGIIT
jgi:hypothetical protein